MTKKLQEREFTAEERKAAVKTGAALPDGSFPILTKDDLANAIQAFGRASDKPATMAHIKKRAKALGMMDALPEEWMKASADMPTETGRVRFLFESSDLQEAQLDNAQFIARGVTLIRPGFSTNHDREGRPRYYPAETLKAAVSAFEGARAFANHPRKSEEKELPERDVRDLTGYYRNVRAADDGRLLADFHVVGKSREWLWPMVAEAVTNKPDLVQLSINALGRTKLADVEGRASVYVESIVGANSVDVVTTGAAGGTFAGALLAGDGGDFTDSLLAALTFDEWRAVQPAFVDKLKSEWKTVRESDALKAERERAQQLQAQLDALTQEHRASAASLAEYQRAAIADRLLAEAALPANMRRDLRAAVLAETDEAGMKKVVEQAQTVYARLPKPPVPVPQAPQSQTHSNPPRPGNPLAPALGLREGTTPLANESAEDYRKRRLRESAATERTQT